MAADLYLEQRDPPAPPVTLGCVQVEREGSQELGTGKVTEP